MQLVINNFKFNNRFEIDSTFIEVIKKTMLEKLKSNKIIVNVVRRNTDLIFDIVDSENKKLAVSSIENKIVLKDGDERIKKMGRNYLISTRLTKNQADSFWIECVNNTLNNLGVYCDIKYVEFKDDPNSVIVLRTGTEFNNELPIKDKTFPVEM